MSEHIPSYGKVWAFGHPTTHGMVGSEVVVEEKIDGSQFSAMSKGGKLSMRSKGADLHPGAIPDLFQPTCAHFDRVHTEGRLVDGWIYRGEAMKGERHNTLKYGRVPLGNCVLFDVDTGEQTFLDVESRRTAAREIGVECVPVFFEGTLKSEVQLLDWLKLESALGGALVEGVVIKPKTPSYYTDGKRIAGKYVSEAFKETHRKTWTPDRPEKGDLIMRIVEQVSGPARFEKAVQRLAEAGTITHSPSDIGALMKLVAADVEEECREDIRDILYDAYRKEVIRNSVNAIPAWYKNRIAMSAFASLESYREDKDA